MLALTLLLAALAERTLRAAVGADAGRVEGVGLRRLLLLLERLAGTTTPAPGPA